MFAVLWSYKGKVEMVATKDLDTAKEIYELIDEYDFKCILINVIKFEKGGEK